MRLLLGTGVVAFADVHHTGFDTGDLGVDQPLDVALAHLAFHQALGIAHAAQAHVADVRLAGHEGHRHLVAQLAFAQVGVEDHDEFIGRTEAAGALHRADHDRTRILQEFLVTLPGQGRVRCGAHRLGEAVVRTGAGHFFEGQARAGADQQVVIFVHIALAGGHGLCRGVDALDAARHETDVLLGQMLVGVQGNLVRLAPADRQPRVGGGEAEAWTVTEYGDFRAVAQFVTQFIGGAHAGQAGTHHDDPLHLLSLSAVSGRLN